MNLDLSRHMQFGGVQLQEDIQSTEQQDRNDDSKIADQGSELEHIQGEQRRQERKHWYRYGGFKVWIT